MNELDKLGPAPWEVRCECPDKHLSRRRRRFHYFDRAFEAMATQRRKHHCDAVLFYHPLDPTGQWYEGPPIVAHE